MRYTDEKISVVFDDSAGFTKAIYNPKDKFNMNWILDNSNWGEVIGFNEYRVEKAENGINVYSKNNSLGLSVEKKVENGCYTENYCITNNQLSDFFSIKDNLGIYFPYNCTFKDKINLHDNSCITHIWCGGDFSWMYSAKPSGAKPYLVCNITKGSISDYSISYDISRTKVGASYRGCIVLNPEEFVLLPGESAVFSFIFRFSDIAPGDNDVNEFCRMNLSAIFLNYADNSTKHKKI